jgi:hypothetical protein
MVIGLTNVLGVVIHGFQALFFSVALLYNALPTPALL